ncbi:hypothetical protein JCM24511_01343, partial [Saitozyma sp. JCM 24511]
MVDERSTSEPIERIGGTEMGTSSPDTQASKSGTVTDRQTGHKPDKQQHPQTAKADVSRADKTRGDEKEGTGRELGNEAKDGKKSKSKSKESVGRRIMNKLPKWLSDSLVDVRTWKTFTRCMIATFGAMVLMLAQPSLNVLGAAAFFGLIASPSSLLIRLCELSLTTSQMSQMLPPSMPLSIYIFALLTLIIGMCTGWAWGCAAMASALRARSQVLLNQQIQTAEAGYNLNANIDAQYIQSIFTGAFLDPASSAVYGIFLFFGAYAFGFLRAAKPRLTLAAVFGTIIMDLMCSFGPLFPAQQYTLARQLLVPAACFMAIALACIIVLFPQTLHSVVLDGTIKACFKPCLVHLQLQEQVLQTKSDDHDKWSELAEKLRALRAGQIAGINGIGGQIKLLELEISRSRMGPGDLAKVFEKSKELCVRAYMLGSFVMVTDERHQSIKKRSEATHSHPAPRFEQHAKLAEKFRLDNTSLDDLLPILADSTAPLRSAAETCLHSAISWLDELNHTRWRNPKPDSPKITVREGNLSRLRSEIDAFRQSGHFEMLKPFREAFDENGQLKPELVGMYKYTGKDLFRCHVFTTNLVYFSLVLTEMLELLLDIERRNPKAKIQLPSKFAQHLVKSANDTEGGGNPLDMGLKEGAHTPTQAERDSVSEETLVDDDVEKSGKGGKAKKDKKKRIWTTTPDAGAPKNSSQKFGRRLAALWRILSSSNGIFALKYALVSIAIWVPAVCPSSAHFNYANRGLWALIMAQMGLGVFTGEQIGSFVLRMSGTVFGLIVGMVAWYMGAARGPGNPYGIAASTMVLIAPFLYLRIVSPPDKMAFWLMIGVTITFTVGYSWVDEHVYQTANQGSGAALAGRRALLVLIGFTAAFLVMLFPKPISAKLLVRRTLAKNLGSIADLYGAVVTGLEDEADEQDGDKEWKAVAKEREGKYRARFLKCMGRMISLQTTMGFASLEPGIQGPWPKAKYQELTRIEGQILSALGLLSGSFARLQPKWCKLLAERSAMMHPAFIADCLALFALLEQSLKTGMPLPPTMPIFERLAYHHAHHRGDRNGDGRYGRNDSILPSRVQGGGALDQTGNEKSTSTLGDKDKDARVEERIENEEEKVFVDLGKTFNWDTLRDEQFAVFATANVALIHIANGLNEVSRVVVELIGERELEGLDRIQERYARADLVD